MELLEILSPLKKRYEKLCVLIADPNVINGDPKYYEYLRDHGKLSRIMEIYGRLEELYSKLEECKSILEEEDSELIEIAKEELPLLEKEISECEMDLKKALLSQDPDTDKNIILEIRAGVGGEEAALFVADIFKMYTWYAEKKGWKVEVMSSNPTELGGFKEIIASISGKAVYEHLRYEGGTHRVQRIPITETGGRIHTSAVTVAILPEVDEIEVEINKEDLHIEVMRSSGPGGQSVNTTDSAVRITHIPTGIVVMCQDEKSQHKNKAKAMRILRSRIYEKMRSEQEAEIGALRRSMIGSGDRSERIRTYNFPQNRLTDHRINLDIYNLSEIMRGELDELIEKLKAYHSEQVIRKIAQKGKIDLLVNNKI